MYIYIHCVFWLGANENNDLYLTWQPLPTCTCNQNDLYQMQWSLSTKKAAKVKLYEASSPGSMGEYWDRANKCLTWNIAWYKLQTYSHTLISSIFKDTCTCVGANYSSVNKVPHLLRYNNCLKGVAGLSEAWGMMYLIWGKWVDSRPDPPLQNPPPPSSYMYTYYAKWVWTLI